MGEKDNNEFGIYRINGEWRVAALFAVRCTQVLGALVALALDQPEAEALKVARRQFVER